MFSKWLFGWTSRITRCLSCIIIYCVCSLHDEFSCKLCTYDVYRHHEKCQCVVETLYFFCSGTVCISVYLLSVCFHGWIISMTLAQAPICLQHASHCSDASQIWASRAFMRHHHCGMLWCCQGLGRAADGTRVHKNSSFIWLSAQQPFCPWVSVCSIQQ